MAHVCNCNIAFALKIFQDRLDIVLGKMLATITLGSVIDAFVTRLEVSQAILILTRKRKYETHKCIEMVQNSPVLVDEMVKGRYYCDNQQQFTIACEQINHKHEYKPGAFILIVVAAKKRRN